MTRKIITMLVFLYSLPVWAIDLGIDRLPGTLAADLNSGAVQASVVDGAIHSYATFGGFNAYAFEGPEGAFSLISYDVLPGSQWDVSWQEATPLSGLMFIEVPQFYIPGTTAQITLHFDQLVPGIPQSAFWSNQPQTTVELQADAMNAGSGVAELSGKYGSPAYNWSGNMSFLTFEDEPFICIECTYFAQLDLIFLDYSLGKLAFNFDDPRTTLFTGYDGYSTSPYGWGLNLVVNQVPLPAGLLLMLGALAPLAWLRRRNQI